MFKTLTQDVVIFLSQEIDVQCPSSMLPQEEPRVPRTGSGCCLGYLLALVHWLCHTLLATPFLATLGVQRNLVGRCSLFSIPEKTLDQVITRRTELCCAHLIAVAKSWEITPGGWFIEARIVFFCPDCPGLSLVHQTSLSD